MRKRDELINGCMARARDPVECDGWWWQWSRAEGDIMRRRADPVRKGAIS